ncbi:MAG TPA: sigma-54 dependent transcriptional regulator [Kofleriaceae bacterium]|jgi:DNA-binding NtrC family response regulator|nr:sigma-54 dependent transcriptional regulator [Kofleriaceae bacterium]
MSERARILVADDEPNLRRVLFAILGRLGHEVVQATDGAEALSMLDGVDVVITDLRMPKVDGMEVLRTAVRTQPHVPVIMVTAYGSVGQAVEAIKAGAFDYVEKPFDQDQIRLIVDKAVRQAVANRAAPRPALYPATDEVKGRHGLVGDSAEMHQIFDVIEKVADSPSTVLITGESGTGKELVAKALHEGSSRHGGPFIKINCAAIPKTLMESELFGYEKGAFTGATSSKPGRFELADGGTLFLDEIGEIPVEMQVKLLRAIQESEFERVGGIKTIKVDVRLITATNRDLEQEIARGGFREDLYYRLNVVPLHIPPLRRRRGDVPLLVRHIIRRFNERLKRNVAGIADDALAALEAHSWPGNIRELENVLERTILFSKHEVIQKADLPDEIASASAAPVPAASPAAAAPVPAGDDDDGAEPGEVGVELSGDASLKDIVRAETNRVERELIARALSETGGNVTQAAKLLKISRKSLQMKMKELGLRDPEPQPN